MTGPSAPHQARFQAVTQAHDKTWMVGCGCHREKESPEAAVLRTAFPPRLSWSMAALHIRCMIGPSDTRSARFQAVTPFICCCGNSGPLDSAWLANRHFQSIVQLTTSMRNFGVQRRSEDRGGILSIKWWTASTFASIFRVPIRPFSVRQPI